MAYDIKKRYKYYFETSYTAHPWSFACIMRDIQHALYNNEGLTEEQIKSDNLINRINSLSGKQKEEAYSELQEARAMANRRAERDNKKRQEMQKAKEEEKYEAMMDYKRSWKQTSFFYKITHKSQNPKNINFDNLDYEEIRSKAAHLR